MGELTNSHGCHPHQSRIIPLHLYRGTRQLHRARAIPCDVVAPALGDMVHVTPCSEGVGLDVSWVTRDRVFEQAKGPFHALLSALVEVG